MPLTATTSSLPLTLPKSGIIVFLNPNSGQSLLYSGTADPHIKDVDVEIIPNTARNRPFTKRIGRKW